MKRIGLVAEYNPFHAGHAYQLSEIKAAHPGASLIVAMSGNVVQRGEFALLDKWQRAQLAVQAGADLVFELPLLASLQSADYFAKWSVDCLTRLGIDGLAFGTETATARDIIQMAGWIDKHQTALDQAVQRHMGQGLSYPASMEAALTELDQKSGPSQALIQDIRLANNLLGLKYYQVSKDLGHKIQLIPIKRRMDLASGCQIRDRLAQGQDVSHWVPPATSRLLAQAEFSFWPAYYNFLKLQIISKNRQDLGQIQGVREGIENLIIDQGLETADFETFVDRLTSRRWTRSAIQRILLAILLNISQADWQAYQETFQDLAVVRILAYNRKGQEVLKEERANDQIQLFANLRKDLVEAYQFILRADRIYSLPYSRMEEQNIGRYPLKFADFSH